MDVEFRHLEPFGQEITGIQCWHPLSEPLDAQIAHVWSRDGLILLRRQALSETELVNFCAPLGKAEIIVREDWRSDNRPEVIRISNIKDQHGRSVGGLGAGELDWHTDQSYVVKPATGSVLYMVEMPAVPPRTYWANLQLAYAALDDERKAQIDGLNVVYDYLVRQSTYDDEPQMSAELRRKTPPVTHPLVNSHPLTGEKALYLDPTTASGIEGMEPTAAKQLLGELCDHATQDAFVYAHDWQIGDVVMWDNGFLMHRRDSFEPTGLRLLKRLTLNLPATRHIVPEGSEFLV